MKRLVVISAGLSTPSTTRMLADQIAGAVRAEVTRRGEGLDIATVEVREYAHDVATVFTTGVPSARLSQVQEQISSADALVLVTPVFAASYSGLFKSFIDVMSPDALNGMPVIIAATAGTPRHQLVLDHALRPLLTYMRAMVMPTGVFAATEDFGGEDSIAGRVARAARELGAYIVRTDGEVAGFSQDMGVLTGGGAAPRRTAATQGEDTVTDFAELLRGHEG